MPSNAERNDGQVVETSLRPHVLLSVLVRQEGEHWIAHLLEHDFVAHGPSRDGALRALAATIRAHIHLTKGSKTSDPLSDVPPAPTEFWTAWEHADRRELPQQLMSRTEDYPPAYVVQAILQSGGPERTA